MYCRFRCVVAFFIREHIDNLFQFIMLHAAPMSNDVYPAFMNHLNRCAVEYQRAVQKESKRPLLTKVFISCDLEQVSATTFARLSYSIASNSTPHRPFVTAGLTTLCNRFRPFGTRQIDAVYEFVSIKPLISLKNRMLIINCSGKYTKCK